jgi:hypothetical protein
MDSAVLGLASPGCGWCTVSVCRQKITLEDAVGSHACSLEANMRVANSIPLGCQPFTGATINCVQTRKVRVELHGVSLPSMATGPGGDGEEWGGADGDNG